MQRRDAIKSLLGLSVVAGCSALPTFANLPQAHNDLLKLNAELFKKAKARNPNLIGFEGVTHDLPLQQLTIEGALPSDFRGAFYRNGPAVHQRNNQCYLHLFEGDGLSEKIKIIMKAVKFSLR